MRRIMHPAPGDARWRTNVALSLLAALWLGIAGVKYLADGTLL